MEKKDKPKIDLKIWSIIYLKTTYILPTKYKQNQLKSEILGNFM